MKTRTLWVTVLVSGLATPALLRADADRLKNAEAVLNEMAGSADAGIPRSLIGKAKCIVIVPGVKKGAIGFGGQYGRGYISCRSAAPNAAGAAAPVVAGRWTAPGGIRIEGGSVGLQIGGSDTDVIMLVMNDRGAERLLSSRFTVGADAAVAAGPVGRQASAQTDATMMAEILAWSRSRGAFAGIALQGSTLREDGGENKELYGKEISNREIIKSQPAVPAAAEGFMKALAKY
jgi:lipid-binding SYLF domain-containing protein